MAQVSNLRSALVVASSLLVVACSGNARRSETRPEAAGCASQDVLVSGHVERDLESPAQYRGDSSLGADSIATVSLYSNPALGGDGASTRIAEQRLRPAPALPFDFCVTGTLPKDATPGLQYHAGIDISQHGRTEPEVGDLVDEFIHVVAPPEHDVVFRVVGIEACSAPDAGGYCATP